MAGSKANGKDVDDINDDSLVDDDAVDGLNGDDTLDESEREDKADKADKADDKDAGATDDLDIEIAEEQTEADLEAKQKKQDAADAGALADDDAAADDKGGEKDPDAQYSKDVRARIAREQRRAREANARAQVAHQGRLKAESTAREKQKQALEVTASALDMQAEATRDLLIKAKDDGKTADEVKLQERLEKINRNKDEIAASAKALEREEEEAKRGGGAENGPNQLAMEWVGRNKWFTDARFAEQAAITRVIDRALGAEGYDKNSPEYYDELDRRVKRRLPEVQRHMQPRRQAEAPARRETPRREPTGGAPRSAAASVQPGGKRKVTLTSADFEVMRNFGLDPKDPKVQREYALNKLSGGK